MHIGNETHAALSAHPQDIHEFLSTIPQVFPQVGIRDNAAALKEVDGAVDAIIDGFHTGAEENCGSTSVKHWHINWGSQWWMLVGHLYLNTGTEGPRMVGRFDPTSPIVLLHRSRNTVYYGKELLPLAVRVLGHQLVYEASDTSS